MLCYKPLFKILALFEPEIIIKLFSMGEPQKPENPCTRSCFFIAHWTSPSGVIIKLKNRVYC